MSGKRLNSAELYGEDVKDEIKTPAEVENIITDSQDDCIVEVENLKKYFVHKTDFFGRPRSYLKAVDGVSFKIKRGTTLGIVGESGCGKTTMGRTLIRLYDPTDGVVKFNGKVISNIKRKEMIPLRKDIQIIFQDPYSSLSPRLPISSIIAEGVNAHNIVPKSGVRKHVLEVMNKCGLPEHYYTRYPHEFSGGQRQRICIARALAVNPQFIVCDEPVSALDVSIQAQIINLLEDLQKDMNLTYLFISHDLSVVEHISDEVGVMYLGDMVEMGSKKEIFEKPMHPYTKALFSAVPKPDPETKMNRIILEGDIPSPVNPPKGCKFHTRCSHCMDICKTTPPVFKEYEDGHFTACHLYDQNE